MKQLYTIAATMCLLICFAFVSCGSKSSHETIQKKMESYDAMSTEKLPLDEADYNFMLDYLIESFDGASRISDYEVLSKDYPHYVEYSFIVMFANEKGQLPSSSQKKFTKLREKAEKYNAENHQAPVAEPETKPDENS